MNREDIIRMAREAGMGVTDESLVPVWHLSIKYLERFAALVAEREREECAKLAEQTVCDTHLPTGVKIYGTRAAKAIRERGETQ